MYLSSVLIRIKGRLMNSERKTIELEKIKNDLFKKTDDLTTFSNLLMKTVEDLERRLGNWKMLIK